jgi:hypothetical protein
MRSPVLGVSPSAYDECEREQESARARRDAELLTRIQGLFVQFPGATGAASA